MNNWTKNCYARILIDNHISEEDSSFMTKFSPAQYVAMVKMAGIESSMVYSMCHNGNCYYPTKVGHMHRNLRGRDIFGETVSLLREEGIVPVAYYTSIYHNHSAKNHPEWRITGKDGRQHDKRYWWSCPNNDEYVAFTLAQIGEILVYDIDGIFNDMTFWPVVCACASCRKKYLMETGMEIPDKINWESEDWISFQRFRERSMASFSQKISDFVKSRRNITVTHQTSTIMAGWLQAYTLGITKACDYTSGDFYGGKYLHSLGAKVLAGITREMPYEFMTSRCVNLTDHSSMKSEAELAVEACMTLANAGAYFFIDAINPDGTLDHKVYKRLGDVSRKIAPFKEVVKRNTPVIVADKALYYSSSAYIDESAESQIMCTTACGIPSVQELLGTAVLLSREHIPFKIISNETKELSGIDTIVMNNIAYTSEEENKRIRKFVRDGGTLIATGMTSLYKPDGTCKGDFALADVFGVSYIGNRSKRFHYLSFDSMDWLVSCYTSAPLVKAKKAKILAKIAEPLFDPDDDRFASIHSNPPGVVTKHAGLSINKYGKGKCIYLSSLVLSIQQDAQQQFGAWLFEKYSPSSIVLDTNAPECVEMTFLGSTAENAFLVCFVNYQKEQPNVPVHNLQATIRLPGSVIPKSCTSVSDGRKIKIKICKGALHLEIPQIENMEIIEMKF